jgi:hypothetical protein
MVKKHDLSDKKFQSVTRCCRWYTKFGSRPHLGRLDALLTHNFEIWVPMRDFLKFLWPGYGLNALVKKVLPDFFWDEIS